LTLLVWRQEGHPACKKTEQSGAGVVICLERDADLHMAQLMPLPLTISCSSKIQIGFTFLVLAHPGSPGKRAVKRVCVCVYRNDLYLKDSPMNLTPTENSSTALYVKELLPALQCLNPAVHMHNFHWVLVSLQPS